MNRAKGKRVIAKILVVVFIAGTILLLGSSFVVFNRACSRYDYVMPPALDKQSAEERQKYAKANAIKDEPNETVRVEASDGTILTGHYYERKTDAPVLIFFHGYRSYPSYDSMHIYDLSKNNGWNLLLVTLRGHHESGGKYITLGVKERYDVLSWATWAAKRFGDDTPIFIMGISFGAEIVTLSSDMNFPKTVCGIIEDSGFTSAMDICETCAKESMPPRAIPVFSFLLETGTKIYGGFSLKDTDVCKALKNATVPVLFIHGDADKTAPTPMAYSLYNACSSEKELVVVRGADHAENDSVDQRKYDSAITEFVSKYSDIGSVE